MALQQGTIDALCFGATGRSAVATTATREAKDNQDQTDRRDEKMGGEYFFLGNHGRLAWVSKDIDLP